MKTKKYWSSKIGNFPSLYSTPEVSVVKDMGPGLHLRQKQAKGTQCGSPAWVARSQLLESITLRAFICISWKLKSETGNRDWTLVLQCGIVTLACRLNVHLWRCILKNSFLCKAEFYNERDREAFYLLIHSPNGFKGHWGDMKQPGVDGLWTDWGLGLWSIVCCFCRRKAED